MHSPDYEEFVELLNAHGVKYLIVGAHAVAFYARPRATKDLDLYIESSPENAARVLEAIRAFFGGHDLGLEVEDLVNLDSVIQLGVAPTRIDLISSLKGIEKFDPAWERRVTGLYGDAQALYVSLEDLIAAKRAADRGQDRVDLDHLLAAR